MTHPTDRKPDGREPQRLDAVLEWFDRHLTSLSRSEAPWGPHLLREMLADLRAASQDGSLSVAWTAHGLEGDDVGPVIVVLSPQGAALASINQARARRPLPRTG